MQHDRLVSGLAGVLAAITVVMTVLGAVYNPAILFVAVTFGAATYLVYYHSSGRLASRVYRTVERQAAVDAGRGRRRRAERRRTDGRRGGGFGAGPREEWTPPRDGATAREAGFGGSRRQATSGRQQGQHQARQTGQRQRRRGARQRTRDPRGSDGPTAAEAYRTLGLDPDADASAVKRAYREKVKEVHPDADGGDEDEFKAVTAAYERLTD